MSNEKTFGINLSKDPAAVVKSARAQAAKHEFEFDGDENEGRFAGKGIQGLYTISGQEMKITIAKKPMLLPWAVIESAITKFFT